ncbi:MAG: hypothetical protein ABWY15_07020 [Methyloceanibacter sp.]
MRSEPGFDFRRYPIVAAVIDGDHLAERVRRMSLLHCPAKVANEFVTFRRLSVERVPLVEKKTRLLHFCKLSGYKGAAAGKG